MKTKKLLALIISLVMILSALPGISLPVFAAESLTDSTTNVTLTPDANGYYQIGTTDELIAFANLVNGGNPSINGILTEDITLNENLLTDKLTITQTEGFYYAKATVKNGKTVNSWTPIGSQTTPYAGTFDGNGKKITGLYVNASKTQQALFGTVTGTVKNVTVAEYYVTGSSRLGAVVGQLDGGTVSNCHANGGWIRSTASGNNGGVVGYATNEAKIEDCTHSGNLYAYQPTGGIVGYADKKSVISRCENTGYLYGGCTRVGGIVGDLESSAKVEYSFNSGTVKANNTIGGVVGYASHSTVEHCYNTGNIIGRGSYASNAGGVVGYLYYSSAEYCYNTGNISGESSDFQIVGGIAGKVSSGIINFCYNTGSLSANDTIGGIAGSILDNNTTISTCYSACTITPTTESNIGSLVGTFYGTLSDNYYDSDKSSFVAIGNNFAPTTNTDTNNNGVPTAQFTSGEVCYLLNGSSSADTVVWKQTLTTAATPGFDGLIVYNEGTKYYNIIPELTLTLTTSNVTIENLSESAVLVVASYNGTQLIDVKSVPVVSGGTTTIASTGLTLTDANTIKAFLWKDISGIKPLCESESVAYGSGGFAGEDDSFV